MSIGRSFFNELRPLFRMLEEPLYRGGAFAPPVAGPRGRSNDPFLNVFTRPAVDITEEGDKYIIDADLPGIKKENLEIKLGDNGESLTIQGKIVDRGRSSSPESEVSSKANGTGTSGTTESKAVTQKEASSESTQISAERAVNYSKNLSFTRTVWLPQPVNPKEISAKLDHGVLTVILKKAKEDKQSVSIPID